MTQEKWVQIATAMTTPLNDTAPAVVEVDLEKSFSEPIFKIVGRIAGGAVGMLTQPRMSLHFTLLIDRASSGLIGIDGQPTFIEAGLKNFKQIRSNFYYNSPPTGIEVSWEIDPPAGMSRELFAEKLVEKAHAFASYTETYAVPSHLIGREMKHGEYNSSSYLAGLLNAVMGFVPDIRNHTRGWQTPGWETPMPASFFKGEALK